MGKNNIEVCFTPAIYHTFHNDEAIVIVVDILRATSAICTAFMNGIRKIIPVATLEEALDYKKKGFMVAAERDGIVRDFADFGNSPYNFTRDKIYDQDIVYSTTNGTNTIMMARKSHKVLSGSYLNFTALANYIIKSKRDIIILCAGWKEKFNLEDTLFAGALAAEVLRSGAYGSICDSTLASTDLWKIANKDLLTYIENVAQRNRLKLNGLDDVIGYCHTFDLTDKIPFLFEDYLILLW
jgi:2-phosphosulfolactate phosphatase